MQIYHLTAHAAAILAEGFRDAEGVYGITDAGESFRGVYVFLEPLTSTEVAKGETLLSLEIPDDLFVAYEWVQEDKPYREALIPAARLNLYGPPRVVDALADGEHGREDA